FTFVANQGDKIIIGKFMDVATLGLYERSYQVVRYLANLVGDLMDRTLSGSFAKIQDDMATIRRVFLEITYILSLTMFPLSFFMIQNAENIVRILLGDKWLIASPIVVAMSCTLFFWIATKLS